MSETTQQLQDRANETLGADAGDRCLRRPSTRRGIIGLLASGVAALPFQVLPRSGSASAAPVAPAAPDMAGVTPFAQEKHGGEESAPDAVPVPVPAMKSGDRSTPAPREPLDFKEFYNFSYMCGYEIKHRFRRLFGLATRVPDKVCINDWVSNGSFGEMTKTCKQTHDAQSICMQNNWGAYKVMAPIGWGDEGSRYIQARFQLDERFMYNNSDEEEMIWEDTLWGWFDKKVTVTMDTYVPRSDQVVMSGKARIDRDFGFGGRTTIQYGMMGVYSADERQGLIRDISVTIPPKTLVRARMFGGVKRGTYTFRHPIGIDGYLGAQFSKRVDGHYHWARHISEFAYDGRTWFRPARGQIVIEAVSDTWVVIDDGHGA